MAKWIISDNDGKMLYDAGNLGLAFHKDPWRDATAVEIEEYQLKKSKLEKIANLKVSREIFFAARFVYDGDYFNADERTLANISAKNLRPVSDPDRYKFYDNPPDHLNNPRKQIDFVDAAGWAAFQDALSGEYDRVMKKYNWYRESIDKCLTVAEVDEITIDFAAT